MTGAVPRLPTRPPSSRALDGLGSRLRALREQAGLSGAELAGALGPGWGQSKVSKIETGRQLPSIGEITDWAVATGATAEPLLALRAKASAEYTAYRERIAGAGGAVARQDEITALITACTFLATYQPALVPGLLQTPAYIQGMALGHEFLTEDGILPDEVDHVIAAKIRRQAILYEPGRQIVHVVGEAALHTRIGQMDVATLQAQVLHLADMAHLPRHVFGVVPFTTTSPITPLAGWSMYDRDLVNIETPDGSLQLTEPSVLARYSRWLDQLLEVALTGAEAAEFCRTVAASLRE